MKLANTTAVYGFFLVLASSGCTRPDVAPPAIEVRTVTVEKPVPVPCVDAKSVPAEPGKVGGQLNGQAAHDLDLVAASALQLRQWGRELKALIAPCVKN